MARYLVPVGLVLILTAAMPSVGAAVVPGGVITARQVLTMSVSEESSGWSSSETRLSASLKGRSSF